MKKNLLIVLIIVLNIWQAKAQTTLPQLQAGTLINDSIGTLDYFFMALALPIMMSMFLLILL